MMYFVLKLEKNIWIDASDFNDAIIKSKQLFDVDLIGENPDFDDMISRNILQFDTLGDVIEFSSREGIENVSAVYAKLHLCDQTIV